MSQHRRAFPHHVRVGLHMYKSTHSGLRRSNRRCTHLHPSPRCTLRKLGDIFDRRLRSLERSCCSIRCMCRDRRRTYSWSGRGSNGRGLERDRLGRLYSHPRSVRYSPSRLDGKAPYVRYSFPQSTHPRTHTHQSRFDRRARHKRYRNLRPHLGSRRTGYGTTRDRTRSYVLPSQSHSCRSHQLTRRARHIVGSSRLLGQCRGHILDHTRSDRSSSHRWRPSRLRKSIRLSPSKTHARRRRYSLRGKDRYTQQRCRPDGSCRGSLCKWSPAPSLAHTHKPPTPTSATLDAGHVAHIPDSAQHPAHYNSHRGSDTRQYTPNSHTHSNPVDIRSR
jgi:hypothetical protein